MVFEQVNLFLHGYHVLVVVLLIFGVGLRLNYPAVINGFVSAVVVVFFFRWSERVILAAMLGFVVGFGVTALITDHPFKYTEFFRGGRYSRYLRWFAWFVLTYSVLLLVVYYLVGLFGLTWRMYFFIGIQSPTPHYIAATIVSLLVIYKLHSDRYEFILEDR